LAGAERDVVGRAVFGDSECAFAAANHLVLNVDQAHDAAGPEHQFHRAAGSQSARHDAGLLAAAAGGGPCVRVKLASRTSH